MSCDLKNEVCNFSCTGFVGGHIWKERKEVIKKIDCESCRDHAIQDEDAYHDVVNIGLGKPPHDAKNLSRYAKQIDCVYSSCKDKGWCK